ncbi:MAG: AI-2E family transporter [Defluviitaleaceae bacterium]|nr:AI-2E family transporter [Defluviitaleaceae bacterium]
MKKIPINKKYLEICVYVLCVVFATLIFAKIIGNFGNYGSWFHGIFNFLGSMFLPFVIGFFIAYIMNTTVKWFERIPYKKVKKGKRLLSVATTFVIYIGALAWIISYLVPQIITSITNLISIIPKDPAIYQTNYDAFINGKSSLASIINLLNQTFPNALDVNTLINKLIEPIINGIMSLPSIINTILSGTLSLASGLLNVLLGFVIAFYMLTDKEDLSAACKKVLYTIFKEKSAEKIIDFFSDTNIIINRFLIGKGVDSLIMAVMFFFICLFLEPRYALLLALIVGISNMIPYLGPIIGAIPVMLIVFLTDITRPTWIWAGIAMLVIQQFDGLYLAPKILGGSTGLRPIAVIFAIIAGGAIAGIPGMFFGVPVLAIVRNLLVTFLNRKYDQKYMP